MLNNVTKTNPGKWSWHDIKTCYTAQNHDLQLCRLFHERNWSCDCLVEVRQYSSPVVFCSCDGMLVNLLNWTYSSDAQKQGWVSAGCSHSHKFVWLLVYTFNLSAFWALLFSGTTKTSIKKNNEWFDRNIA